MRVTVLMQLTTQLNSSSTIIVASDTQQIPRLLWSHKFHYRVYSITSLVPTAPYSNAKLRKMSETCAKILQLQHVRS